MTDPKAEVDQLIRLALWCREHRFLIGDVTIGSLRLRIKDLQVEHLEEIKRQYSPPPTLFEEAGLDGAPEDGTVG